MQFRFNAGYELDNTPASGQTLRGGAALPPGFSDQRQFVNGDLAIGAKDIGLRSLGGYFLAGYQFDTQDTLVTRTGYYTPYDATGQQIAIKAGYAEYQSDDKDGNHAWVRAGRQFRLDGGAMFAYFDGATVGYRTDNGVSVSAFGGERVSLYIDTVSSASSTVTQNCVTNGIAQPGTSCTQNAGLEFGATASIDLKKSKGIPLKIGVDFLGLSIDQVNGVGDEPLNTSLDSLLRTMIALTASYDLNKQAHLDNRARGVDTGGGFGFGRAGARLRYSVNKDIMVVADVDQRGDKDYAYDLAAASQVDVVDISRRLGVGLGAPINSTQIGAHVDWRHGNREIIVFGRANIPEDTVTSVDQQGWQEVGIGLAGAPLPSSWVTLQYTFRHYGLNDSTTGTMDNGLLTGNIAGTAFDDLSGSGLRDMHELAADGWWRNKKNNNGQLRLGAGVFYRIYDLETPYVTVDTEGRGGGRLDFQYWLSTQLHLLGVAEVAQPSPTTMREIDTMESVRIALEARW